MKIRPEQAGRVHKLLKACCNYDRGSCLLLDCPCPQSLSLTRISCKYFRKAVLPAFPELEKEIYEMNIKEKNE